MLFQKFWAEIDETLVYRLLLNEVEMSFPPRELFNDVFKMNKRWMKNRYSKLASQSSKNMIKTLNSTLVRTPKINRLIYYQVLVWNTQVCEVSGNTSPNHTCAIVAYLTRALAWTRSREKVRSSSSNLWVLAREILTVSWEAPYSYCNFNLTPSFLKLHIDPWVLKIID